MFMPVTTVLGIRGHLHFLRTCSDDSPVQLASNLRLPERLLVAFLDELDEDDQ